jgi:lactate dehydrogenase-like 2-hydroxyacid dehydrogenase
MTTIFFPQPIPPAALEGLEKLGEVRIFPHLDRSISRSEVLEGVVGADVLFAIGGVKYDAEVMDAAGSSLRLISAMHVWPYYVDIPEATARAIPVSGIIDMGLQRTTAEFTVALIMSTAWRIPEADTFLREGRWMQNQSEAFLGTRLFDKTLGIVGLGGVGTRVAAIMQAIGMKVLYTKRNRLSPAEEFALGVDFASIEDLFRESDIVAITVPLTAQTTGLVGSELLDLLRPDSLLINTSRGSVLDEAAVEQRLADGRIRGAGLDVFAWEGKPDPGPSPLLKSVPNTVLTPHIGSAARETREAMALRTVANIEAYLGNGRPIDLLNPEVFGDPPLNIERVG